MIDSVVVDTDVVSFTFKEDTRADAHRPHLHGKLTVISFMTLAELDRWAIQYGWGETRRRSLDVFLQDFIVTFSDRTLCRKWAEAVCAARRNGRPIRTADSWIAATALMHGIPLVTNNRSNYIGVDNLILISETP